ncbi:MAG: hypothetical protein RSA29_13865 [Clostridium sp.]|uniref:hypothetical protein n=1 Tax=Clostridium sp. TaxID=1506 RepID=UPI003054476B
MKNIFMPYYMNEETLRHLFKIAINRYANIEINGNRQDTTIQATVPLSELSCGKILQGSATITFTKSINRINIEEVEKSSINVFITLESLLRENKAIKTISSPNDFKSISPGDIIELECTIEKSDTTLEFLKKTQDLMEFQQITTGIDNTSMLNWISKNISEILDSKALKCSTEPLFNSDTTGVISLCSKHSLTDMYCYVGKPVTIVGEVTGYDGIDNSTAINSDPLVMTLLWNYINSNENYKSFIPHLNYSNNIINQGRILEIVPFMIYL